MKYRPEIDGLRAVAVVPVVLFHAGFGAFGGGFVGVDIFFVISGYLITTIIAEEIRRDTFSLLKFYERRARRILPALFTVCLACVPFAWLWMSPPEYKDFAQSLVGVTVFASNILFWQESGYFAPAVDLKPLLHTWSLAVEEQFYVFFPLLLLVLRRFRTPAVTALLGGICVISLVASIHWANVDPSAAFYLIPTRAWELGIGALLALTPPSDKPFDLKLRSLATLAGLGLIAFAIAQYDEGTPFPSYFALAPVVGTALLIRFSNADDFVGKILRLPLLVKIGLISYSLYLWHQPILAFLRLRKLHEPSQMEMLIAVVLAFVLAVITWKFVETPFRRRDVVPAKTIVVTGASASVLLMAIGVAGHVTQGFENATANRANAAVLERKLAHNRGLSGDCEGAFNLSATCRSSDEPEIVVWGDSYAMHLVDALLASNPGARIIQFTTSVCGPIVDLAPMSADYPEEWAKGCLQFNRQALEWMAAHKSVKYAILSSPLDQYMHEHWKLYTPDGPHPSDWQLAAEKFSATLDTLVSYGISPVVVSPPPSFGHDLGRCLFRLNYLQLDDSCDFPESRYRTAMAHRIRFLQELDERHEVLWLDQFTCRQGTCAAALGEVFLYRDQGHLSHEGSAALGKQMRFYERITGHTVN